MATQEMDMDDNAFDKLLQRLEPDLPHSEARYKHLRFKMTKFFEWRHCEDAEDLADETINRTVNWVTSGKEIRAENPYAFIYAVANNIYKEYVRNQIKKEKLLKNLSDEPLPEEDSQDCRIQCLQKLAPEKLKLLQQYYLNVENREALAQELNLTLNALRLQVHRFKKELRTCHTECRKKILSR